ncbi:MAG: NifB/NifX family molybdenum-iron cluster-binding protein [Candidatus Magnetoovum sp. WYHC-5]|nr:NifB/NifX family molybdenum-iron cluster-binding protein [Candidatus Magnetoovum sp. WYHC-5]
MKLCFPTTENKELKSHIYDHFGSAPIFLIFDTETEQSYIIDNRDLSHNHGACDPIKALNNQKVDAVIVKGIGGGALQGLLTAGIKVYQANNTTVENHIKKFKENSLNIFSTAHVCGGHHACHH